ncbi:MAG: hypothetical protein WBG71_06120 [Leeuwenhoekiella sp.]
MENTNLSENINRDNDSACSTKELPEDSETVIQFIQANINPIAEEYRI